MIIYSATSACAKGQPWITAVAFLREMQQWQMQANMIKCNVTISACENVQRRFTAVALLRDLRQSQMRLSS